ncbi:MAG: phosphoglucosamine mutase [candidate division WOR-3 bacterium]
MAQPIFTISGLRGIVGESLFLETVREMAAGYVSFLGPGRFAIGRDSRPSGAELAAAARAALLDSGCEVVDLGICPTPTVVHYVRSQKNIRGGIVITASHNPVNWNGMKFVHPDGRFILPAEFEGFKRVIEECKIQKAKGKTDSDGTSKRLSSQDGIAGHIRAIRGHRFFADVEAKGLRIGVDAVNGAASLAAPELLRTFGCEVIPLFCSPEKSKQGFPRRPEPTPENLSELCELVQQEQLDAGFAFDPDGDRFSCVDERGVPLGEETSLCLACLYVLPKANGDVVVNLSTSRAVEDVCARFGSRVIRTKVGEAFVVERMIETGAVLGGEGNGGVILPEINLTRDGLIAAAIVLALMAKTKTNLSQIGADLPKYFISKGAFAAKDLNREKLIPALRPELADFTVDQTDGIRITGDSWWIHIRKSNTEPLIRVVAEAKTKEMAEGLVNRINNFYQGR